MSFQFSVARNRPQAISRQPLAFGLRFSAFSSALALALLAAILAAGLWLGLGLCLHCRCAETSDNPPLSTWLNPGW